MSHLTTSLKSYRFPIILLIATILGGCAGALLKQNALTLKPLGDIFLNLMFTIVTPLIFFSVVTAIGSINTLQRFKKIIASMFIVFIFTGTIASIYMIVAVKIFPPAANVVLAIPNINPTAQISIGEQLVNIFTVPDFTQLFSHQHLLALIIFSILVGLAASLLGDKNKNFLAIMNAGNAICMKLVSFIMYYAPIGFFAYFAVLVGEFGPKLFGTYFQAMLVYYGFALLYFLCAFTFYAYLAAQKKGVALFWHNAIPSIFTSLATCSSAASIPVNLQSTKNMRVPADIYETVIPLGAILHKDGSVLGAIVKIAFLFGIYHMSFSGPLVLFTAILVAILVGTIMGAIPSGGMVAEMLILNLYGFPPQALMIVAVITMMIDPPATMLNVVGDSVSSMLVARLVEGKHWLEKKTNVLSN